MSKKKIKAILWKKVMQATVDTLIGKSSGQYHIELGRGSAIEQFFDGFSRDSETEKGGFEVILPIHPVGGDSPVEPYELTFKYLGPDSARKTWYIRAQRPETAYPLWRQGRGFELPISSDEYIVLVRDSDDAVHARWITQRELSHFPNELQTAMNSRDFDVNFETDDMATVSKKAIEIIKLLKSKKNVLLYGPPGTGKTHLMQEVAMNFNTSSFEIDTDKERDAFSSTGNHFEDVLHKFVTFHQSYSYEDFVIGLRPDPESEKLLSLSPTPGVFLELSEFCRNPKNASLLSIDEINRGNVSRILGEFITLIEPNKRLNSSNEKTSSTVEITLPYMKSDSKVNVSPKGEPLEVPVPFSLPQNLFTLASMNSVDKSVAPLDAAIRRRFHIVPLEPDLRELKEHLYFEADSEDVKKVKKVSIELLDYLNCSIAQFIGKDYQLGHWYFSPLCNHFEDVKYCEEVLVDVWLHKVIPQLEELFHSRIEQLIAILKLTEETKPLRVNRPDDEFEQLGAASFIESNQGSTPEECLRHIKIICGDQENTAHEG
ncbi:AAA family ATPase [Pseudoalteromonas elyakovii]|nr:AAA family ATPase [Pseudoalteromonas elyakovii]